jgi:hypothetical protein
MFCCSIRVCGSRGLSLARPQVRLQPAHNAKFAFLTILSGKAKCHKWRCLERSSPRRLGLSFIARMAPMASQPPRPAAFPRSRGAQKADRLRATFVAATFGARLGESGADAFTIMKLMGHSTVTVSQRYVHPSPEAIELAYARFTYLNAPKPSPRKSPKSESRA